MKFSVPVVGCFIVFAPVISAQVNVDLSLGQEQFLPGESIEVGVRITNYSGQKLHVGKDADWLRFTVEGKDDALVSATGEVPVQAEFDVESSKVATRRSPTDP